MNNRLPSLDGLRALAISMVVYAHLTGTLEFQKVNLRYFNYFISGDFGVHIFFVISGFLITSLLLDEEKKEGRIRVDRFYLKRVFRIFPAYYLFIFIMVVLDKYFVNDLDIQSIIKPLTYTTGLWSAAHEAGWTLGHSWTLSVEEQYYLLYPFFLVLVTNPRLRTGCVWISIFLMTFVFRIVVYKYYAPTLMTSIIYRGDTILWGCLLAFYSNEIKLFFISRRFLLNAMILISLGINIILKYFSSKFIFGFLTIPFTNTFQSVFALLLIIRFTLLPVFTEITFRFLNSKIVVFFGMLSYSIYLWQEFVLQPEPSPFLWKRFPLNLVAIFVLGYLSYSLIEKPFLKLRDKIIKTDLP